MGKEKDLKDYQIRTDLIVDLYDSKISDESVLVKEEVDNGIKVLEVEILNDRNKLKKKRGKYITISYSDVTDKENSKNLTRVLTRELKKMYSSLGLHDSDKCLVVGLGNNASTPDALGPKTIEKVLVTRYLYEIEKIEVDKNYRNVASFVPGVTGNTGIESSDIILGIVDKIKPDFIIVVDALASSSIDRVNKTIQLTDSGIHPGSGVYNNRGELSYETLHIPVISIGIPTVIEAFVLVSDTIGYLFKHFSYNIDNYNKNKLVPVTLRDYKEYDKDLSEDKKKELLGSIGTLEEDEVKSLIFEVLTPIGYNMMVTPKEIDFVIEKSSQIISHSINQSLHRNYDI